MWVSALVLHDGLLFPTCSRSILAAMIVSSSYSLYMLKSSSRGANWWRVPQHTATRRIDQTMYFYWHFTINWIVSHWSHYLVIIALGLLLLGVWAPVEQSTCISFRTLLLFFWCFVYTIKCGQHNGSTCFYWYCIIRCKYYITDNLQHILVQWRASSFVRNLQRVAKIVSVVHIQAARWVV
jgi:hypothetical protein